MFFLFLIWLIWPLPAAPPEAPVCAISPDYYEIDLVTTRRVPGSGSARGVGKVQYMANPFGISMTADGSYAYKLDIAIDRLMPARKGHYVAWVSTPEIDQIQRVGPLNEDHQVQGEVTWNKFLVIITLEQDTSPEASTWKGPVVLRGISRSGLMHTMAGHGPYEQEPCAIYGY